MYIFHNTKRTNAFCDKKKKIFDVHTFELLSSGKWKHWTSFTVWIYEYTVGLRTI